MVNNGAASAQHPYECKEVDLPLRYQTSIREDDRLLDESSQDGHWRGSPPSVTWRHGGWAGSTAPLFWIQWMMIIGLAVSTSTLWMRLRACGADPRPAAERTFEPFVPESVTAATNPLNYGYYVPEPIPYDLFHNISILEQRLSELEYFRVGTGVKANNRFGSYIDGSGEARFLNPKLTINDTQAYVIAGLHHMHCLMETLRDYGYLVNGYRPQWNDHHVIHCFNLWYKAIACAADSTAEGYTQPFGSVPMNKIQRASWASSVPRCRDFGALIRWAKDPVRSLPFHYDSGHLESRTRFPTECAVTRCRDREGWTGLD